MNYALDTNTLIYFFKGQGRVAERLLSCRPSDIGIPAVVLYEIELGIAKSSSSRKRRKQVQALLDTTRLIPFGAAEARESAQIRASLERSGQPIGPLDTLIAGCARARGLALVTHNLAEFCRVPKLKIEDWY